MTPHYFSSSGDHVFGAYHPAEFTAGKSGTNISPAAVVICPAFGQEAIRSHKSLLALANRLSRQGIHVLRFAYRGTDDSSLWSDEILSLQDWKVDIVAAKEQLKRLSGCTSVMLLGLRLGANLAADVAADSADVHSVVLWEPIENGTDYLANLRSNHREMIDLWHSKVINLDTEETEELFSARYQRCLLAEIERVRLSTDHLQQPTLIAGTARLSGNSNEPDVVSREAMDKCIESAEPDGWQELNQLEVVWWRPQSVNQLAAGIQEMLTRVEARGWHRQHALVTNHHSQSSITDSASMYVEPREALEVFEQEESFRESVVQLGSQAKLVSVLTEPAHRLNGSPIVLMLNAGIVHRVGPFRLHVNLARYLAHHGIASLRIDCSGLGDSQLRTGKLSKDERVRLDMDEAMKYLEEQGMGNRFVLFGLCSGAYHAHQVAVEDSRVVGAIFLDGIVFRTVGYYLRHKLLRLFRPRFWRNAIKRRWLSVLRKTSHGYQETGNKIAEAEYFQVDRPRETIAAELRLLASRSADLLFVYTGDYDDVCGRAQFREMFGISPNDRVQVDYMANASHTFRIAEHREQLSQRIASWLKERCCREAP